MTREELRPGMKLKLPQGYIKQETFAVVSEDPEYGFRLIHEGSGKVYVLLKNSLRELTTFSDGNPWLRLPSLGFDLQDLQLG